MSMFTYFPLFLLVLVRMTTFFVSAPLWMNQQIPAQFKLGVAFLVSILVVGSVHPDHSLAWDHIYFLLVLKEVFVGLCLGFFVSLLLYAVQLAGSFVDLQSGFAMASLFDPQTGIQEPLTGRFFHILAIVFFLSVDGHHLLIRGVIMSYEWVAIDSWLPAVTSENLVMLFLEIMKKMFWIAFLIAAPLVGTLFLVDIFLGILAKTVPQMNLFAVGVPVKLIIHFLVLYVFIPVFFYVLERLVSEMVHSFEQILSILG